MLLKCHPQPRHSRPTGTKVAGIRLAFEAPGVQPPGSLEEAHSRGVSTQSTLVGGENMAIYGYFRQDGSMGILA